jgi:serine/threonine-protein kinase HipA
MSDQLFVRYEQLVIGRLWQNESSLMRFEYDDKWRSRSDAFPISLSLPLDGSFSPSAGHNFFANLLPEGAVREQICRSLGISQSNDYELLKAIGGDCAGALSLSESKEPESEPSLPRYEPVTDDQLAQWSRGSPRAFSKVTGQNEVRLSLAGAQDKLPVHLDGQQIFIPLLRTPSTHILKFTSPYYSHLPENEAFTSMLASSVGLKVVEITLRKTSAARIAVISRYDRELLEGQFRRKHQEDFCQALGLSPSAKYEKEGGPSIRQCAEVIRRYTSFPLVDLKKLLDWILFNLLIGNADAHGKNLSLLYTSEGSIILAPFYDLVCTRNYPSVFRHLAMNVGGVFDPDLVRADHLRALAADLKVRSHAVLGAAIGMIQKITYSLPKITDQFVEMYGQSPVVERLPIVIRRQMRRIEQQLK